MVLSQTFERARQRRRTVDKPQFNGFVTDLIGSSLERSDEFGTPSPQAFLVEQPARWELQTHFHLRHQFQLVVRGGGMLGRHPVGRLAIHYASAHSGYGPLVAGDEGIAYLTLRAVSDTSAQYLPDARDLLKLRIPKQQAHAAPAQVNVALDTLARPVQETLLELDAGGLAAWLVRMPANTQAATPHGAALGGGRFHVVTRGSLQHAGDDLEALAAVFTGRDETLVLRCGARGAEVVVLQFPAAAMQPLTD